MIYTVLVILHVIGTAIGAGGATFSDWIFFHAARDGKIDKSELALLKAGSLLVTVGLIILIVSGFGFLIHYALVPDSGEALPKVYAKLVIVAIISANGWVLHRHVLPLITEAARKNQSIVGSVIEKNKTLVLTAGAISFVSWYAALILGAWRGLSLSVDIILLIYFVVLAMAIVVSQLLGRMGIRHIQKK